MNLAQLFIKVAVLILKANNIEIQRLTGDSDVVSDLLSIISPVDDSRRDAQDRIGPDVSAETSSTTSSKEKTLE